MFEMTTLMAYLGAAVAIVLAPGPGQAMVLARSLSRGRTQGIMTSFGLNVGTLVHTVAAALGLSAVLMTSALAFGVVKFVGAGYLIYLGIKALRDPQVHTFQAAQVSPQNPRQEFVRAIVAGILNPKVALFFLAFLPQFVNPERGMVLVQFLILGTLLALLGTLWGCVLAAIAGPLGQWFARNPRVAVWQQRLTGGVLIGLGARLALARQK